jgi:hypothetical protein
MQALCMAHLAKTCLDGHSSSKERVAKLWQLPTLQAGTGNGGTHPFQMPLHLENLEFNLALAWPFFGGHRFLGQPRNGQGLVNELHLLKRSA